MEAVEVSAKTVEEAVELALEKLGLSREQVEVTVLNKGKSGLLGLGSEEARVRVTPLPDRDSGAGAASTARELLESLLRYLRIDAGVEVSSQTPPEAHPGSIALEIRGQDLGILIGRRGQNLSAIQYLVNVLLAHRLKARHPVFVNVEGYKKRRYQMLHSLAERMAEQVKASGQSVILEPMPAHERRIVHLALADNQAVSTRSIGEDEGRKVMILPKGQPPEHI